MKKLIQSVTGGYASSARVVDGTLILSLPDAVSPIVWRMDLAQVETSALEVRALDNGVHMLTLKTAHEDLLQIAPFASRGPAVKALMAASRALEQGQGRSRIFATGQEDKAATPAHVTYNIRKGGVGKWLAGLAAIILIIVLLNIKTGMQPPTGSLTGGGMPTAASMLGQSAPDRATGVPVSAEDFLRARN